MAHFEDGAGIYERPVHDLTDLNLSPVTDEASPYGNIADAFADTGLIPDQDGLDVQEGAEHPASLRDILHNRFDSLAAETAEAVGRINTALEVHGQADACQEKQAQAFFKTHGRMPHDYERQLLRLELIQSLAADESDRRQARALAGEVAPLLERACAAEAFLLPMATIELSAAHTQAVSRTDWDAVMRKAVSTDEYDGLGGSIDLIGTQQRPADYGLDETLKRAAFLRHFTDYVAAQGDRLPEDESYDVPSDWQPDVNLPERILRWTDKVQALIDYFPGTARYEHMRATYPGQELYAAHGLAVSMGLGQGAPRGADVVPQVADALQRCADDVMRAFEEADDAFLAAQHVQLLEPLEIQHTEVMTETLGILNVQLWIEDRLTRYPDSAAASVRAVDFVYDETSDMVDGVEVWTEGHVDCNRGALTLNVSSGSMVDVSDSFDHEMGHLIASRLPLAELAEYDSITELETDPVMQEVGAVPSQRGNPENLASACELYMGQPLLLLKDGTSMRFDFFQRIIGRYAPDEIDAALKPITAATAAGDTPAVRRLVDSGSRFMVRMADRRAAGRQRGN